MTERELYIANRIAEREESADFSKKKKKKARKRFTGRYDVAAPATVAQNPVVAPTTVATPTAQPKLKPAQRAVNTAEQVTAHQSSALIAINCLLLAVGAFAAFRGHDHTPLWTAWAPLAITNISSLVFSVLSAPTHVYGPLRIDYDLHQADLTQRQSYLRTAYRVLLGGVPVSILILAICIALASRQ